MSDAELLDWFNVEDTYTAGIAEVEKLPDGNVRLSWYTSRRFGEEPARVLVACLVMAAETAVAAGQRMTQCAAPAEKERGPALSARSSTLN